MTTALALLGVYAATTLFVFGGMATHRDPSTWHPSRWVLMIFWPVTLVVLFFASLGMLISMATSDDEKADR